MKQRFFALGILIIGLVIGWFVFSSERIADTGLPHFPEKHFTLGLDLSGGSHLVYRADVSGVPDTDVKDAMASLRDVIERRVNLFGVSEPQVTNEHSNVTGEERLVVDLPGVTDIGEAIAMIGQTPLLEFKVENPLYDPTKETQPIEVKASDIKDGKIDLAAAMPASPYLATDLTGRYLKRATVEFNQTTHEPIVALQFDDTGAALFEKMTEENVGKTIAIYLDGSPISTPRVNEKISGGQAIISGNFTPDVAKTLVGRLNSGALPVPIELISTQTIGATLGADAVAGGIKAAIAGFAIIALFLILFYRLPGLVAVIALSIYVALMLALFKLMPVTLSAAGIAGFIISIGLAVDANVLIFERMKEEMRNGRTVGDAMHEGFHRAWPSIRDSNISTILSMLILFWFGTSLIKGFALTFGLGVLISMLSAITISRRFLYAIAPRNSRASRFLFSSGLSTGKVASDTAR